MQIVNGLNIMQFLTQRINSIHALRCEIGEQLQNAGSYALPLKTLEDNMSTLIRANAQIELYSSLRDDLSYAILNKVDPDTVLAETIKGINLLRKKTEALITEARGTTQYLPLTLATESLAALESLVKELTEFAGESAKSTS